MLIDTHCHVHNLDLFGGKDFATIKSRAIANDIHKIIVIGTSFEDSKLAAQFATENSTEDFQIYWTYGVHPSEFEKYRETPAFLKTTSVASDRVAYDKNSPADRATPIPCALRPLAIGEVGLDYHYGPEYYETDAGPFAGRHLTFDEIKTHQYRLLEEMLDLAIKADLPLSFHVREAFDDFFGILSNFPPVRGVIHSFSDNKKNLKKCLDYGFYIGVNGMATYSTLPLPPLDRTLTETDAPYLAPVPHRHEINEPANILYIAEWLAEKHQLPLSEVSLQLSRNAAELYNF